MSTLPPARSPENVGDGWSDNLKALSSTLKTAEKSFFFVLLFSDKKSASVHDQKILSIIKRVYLYIYNCFGKQSFSETFLLKLEIYNDLWPFLCHKPFRICHGVDAARPVGEGAETWNMEHVLVIIPEIIKG